ncbi:MAG: two-component regulator propeller domain-containing protein [Ferruginibacter sp.]
MQDNDGYMWFGTGAGVSRFDGKEFKNFTVKDGLTDNDILKIYKDSKGRLWFLTLKGLLCYYLHGKIYNPSNDPSIPGQKAYNGFLSFLEDSNHELWFGGLGGQLVKIPSSGKPEMYDLDSTKKRGKSGWVLLYQPEKDRIALNGPTRTHTYNTLNFSEVKNSFDLTADSVIVYVNTSTYGGILVSKAGIIELNGYQKKMLASSDTLPFIKNTVRINVDSRRGLWVITNDKNTWYFENENGKYKSPRLFFSGENISGVFIDNEGNQWFSTTANGVYKVADNQKWISMLLGDNYYKNKFAESILSLHRDRQNNIWMGSENGKLYVAADFTEPVEQLFSINNQARISAIAESNKKTLFFLTDYNIFSIDLNKDYRQQKATPLENINSRSAKNICFDKDDNLIFSTISGIKKIIKTIKGKDSAILLPNVPIQRIYTLCNDYNNRLWFEIFERLYCYENGNVKSYPRYDSLFINKITSIVQAKDSTLLIATQNNGVFLFKNDRVLANINKKEGLTGTLCRKLYLDGDQVYVSTNDGFTSFTYANGKIFNLVSYNSVNGVFSGDVNDITADERFIYLATSRGVCRIDKKIQINKSQPPVLKINFIDTGDSLITNFNDLGFNYSKFSISINFTAITFDQPDKVLYQYKLKNEDHWIDSKSNSLQLSELPPGKYSISVRAKKINSDWCTPQNINFSIIPPFWKTVWFQLLAFFVLCILVYLIVKRITLRNYRLQLAELKAKQQIEEERSRIASDMHDDLGADISKIAVISEVIKADPLVANNTTANVQKISGYATGLRKKMDDIIWALNPSNDKLIDLVAHIRGLAADFTDESNIVCNVFTDGSTPDLVLPATLRRNFFLIVKEAMNNSMKHAAAGKMHISIEIQNKKLVITMIDDGRGFDINNRNGFGNGINNMAKRVAQVNGTIDIKSVIGKGTTIKIGSYI